MQGVDAQNTVNVTYDEVSTEQPRWISEQSALIGESVDVLGKVIDSLTERLGPILAPDSPHAMIEQETDSPPRSQFADDLAHKAERLFALIERVRRLEGRLEI